MSRTEIFETIDRLRAEARPFCTATVIRSVGATSVKAGAKAAIGQDGEIIGHLGGGCVAGALRDAAAAALADGLVRVIRVEPDLSDGDDLYHFRSGCPSRGTLDLLIEPFGQPPMIAVLGTTPVAAALARQIKLLDYRLAAVATPDPAGPGGRDGPDLSALGLGPEDFVVVATQGRNDFNALRAALATGAGYVAMVSSGRKAAALTERLRAEGVSETRLAELRAPAGIDLGGFDPEEIAVSVIAEVIRIRSRRRRQRDTVD